MPKVSTLWQLSEGTTIVDKYSETGLEEWEIANRIIDIKGNRVVILINKGVYDYESYSEKFIEISDAGNRIYNYGTNEYSESGSLPNTDGILTRINSKSYSDLSPLMRSKVIRNGIHILKNGIDRELDFRIRIPTDEETHQHRDISSWNRYIDHKKEMIHLGYINNIQKAVDRAYEAYLEGEDAINKYQPPEYYRVDGEYLNTYELLVNSTPYVGVWETPFWLISPSAAQINDGDNPDEATIYNDDTESDYSEIATGFISTKLVINVQGDTKVYRYNGDPQSDKGKKYAIYLD